MRLPTFFLLASACTADKPGDDTASVAGSAPCDDGTWGYADASADAVHVRAGASGGDGTYDAPVATLEDALALTRVSGAPKRVIVGAGTYTLTDTLVLADDLGGGVSDTGLVIEGCSRDTVVLEAPDGAAAISAARVTGLELRGLAFTGGRRTLTIWQAGSATLENVGVSGSERLGILMDGSYGLQVTMTDVTVSDVRADDDDGTFGYGVAAQGDDRVELDATALSVTGATAVGILASGVSTRLDLQDVVVDGTASAADGTLGRGIQVQDLAILAVSGASYLRNNADAGLFALYYQSVTAEGLTIEGTIAADAAGEGTGDGVVLTQGDGTNYDPADFPATFTDVTVTGSERAGIFLSGVTAEAAGTAATDNGFTVGGTNYPGFLLANDAVLDGETGVRLEDLGASLTVTAAILALDEAE